MASTTTPFVSEAERRKWQHLKDEGTITQEQYDARHAATGPGNLPERGKPRTRTVGASRSTAAAQIGKTRY
jgi:hypothetical protein